MVHQGAGDGHPLLLAAGQAADGGLFIARQVDQPQHLLHPLPDLGLGQLFQPEAEGDVLVNIEMGEQGIPLKNGVHLPLVGGQVGDVLSIKIDHTCGRGLKTADQPQCCGLAAARRPKQGDKFLVPHV